MNGGKNTAGVLYVENIIENFFSRIGLAGCCAGYNLDPNRNTTLSERDPTRLVATFKAAT